MPRPVFQSQYCIGRPTKGQQTWSYYSVPTLQGQCQGGFSIPRLLGKPGGVSNPNLCPPLPDVLKQIGTSKVRLGAFGMP